MGEHFRLPLPVLLILLTALITGGCLLYLHAALAPLLAGMQP